MAAKTLEEMRKELEGLKAKAAMPALSAEEEEMAQLREERAKLKARIEAQEKAARETREDGIFEELEAKHTGETLHRIDATGGMIVMRSPSVAKSRHFQSVALKGKLSADALEDFVKPCILHPAADELEARIEKAPMLVPTLVSFAQEIGSEEAKRRTGK
jgi:hypothetical protein